MTQDELLQLIEQAEREQWTELDLRGQWLRVIPPEIGRLTRLENAAVNGTNAATSAIALNFISDLPVGLVRLTNLTSSTWENHPISALP